MSFPTKLTVSLQKRMVALAEKGHHIKTICQATGIHRDTYYDWQDRASAGEEPYLSWAEAVSKARADYLVSIYEEFEKMARKQKSLTAFQWMMERGWPALFGSRLRIDSAEIDERIHSELARQSAGRMGGVAARGESGVLPEASGDAVDIKITHVAASLPASQQEDWENLPPEFGSGQGVSSQPRTVSTSSGRARQREDDGGKLRSSKKNKGRAVGRNRVARQQPLSKKRR